MQILAAARSDSRQPAPIRSPSCFLIGSARSSGYRGSAKPAPFVIFRRPRPAAARSFLLPSVLFLSVSLLSSLRVLPFLFFFFSSLSFFCGGQGHFPLPFPFCSVWDCFCSLFHRCPFFFFFWYSSLKLGFTITGSGSICPRQHLPLPSFRVSCGLLFPHSPLPFNFSTRSCRKLLHLVRPECPSFLSPLQRDKTPPSLDYPHVSSKSFGVRDKTLRFTLLAPIPRAYQE